MSEENFFTMPVSVASLRLNLGEALGQAHYNNRIVPVQNHGKPYAAVVSHSDAELLAFLKEASSSPVGSELRSAADTLLLPFYRAKASETNSRGRPPVPKSRDRTAKASP